MPFADNTQPDLVDDLVSSYYSTSKDEREGRSISAPRSSSTPSECDDMDFYDLYNADEDEEDEDDASKGEVRSSRSESPLYGSTRDQSLSEVEDDPDSPSSDVNPKEALSGRSQQAIRSSGSSQSVSTR
ncbi:hypothetical protein BDN71DRAFT_1450646 [Pleurotus eryngii]|uniref:Uncharacterized protein n=1 Tax=Pleurotus eryngii TaxID=5323 RepID=A0A9P5ZTZ7_PLEER|nr:hypothetical protein BDN71DRAFT_1450646 [Pleurotus eryngii]